jgi:hypothetical protein
MGLNGLLQVKFYLIFAYISFTVCIAILCLISSMFQISGYTCQDTRMYHWRAICFHSFYMHDMLRCFPFSSLFTTFIVSVILPYVFPVFNVWSDYPELQLLFLIACMFSLHLIWTIRPVCPIYFSGQSIYLFWYTPRFRTHQFAGGVLLCFVLYSFLGRHSTAVSTTIILNFSWWPFWSKHVVENF